MGEESSVVNVVPIVLCVARQPKCLQLSDIFSYGGALFGAPVP